ncbi:hypothetical protein MUP32_05335, partial [Candidatus Microgenomates bacterium]|nr:hypothetical protein [Candidatus Microgenomates bacterium]
MTDVTNPIQINPVQSNPVQSPAPPKEKPGGLKISVKKIFLSLFIIFICLLIPTLVLFLNPFGILTNRINQAKTIAINEKSAFEKFIDGVVLFPEKVTGKVMPTDRKVDSFLNEQIKSYYENSDKKQKTPIRYSNQPDFSSTSPTATPSGNNVQGVSTSMGEVLQAATTNQLYFQYIPLPGKANFASSQFNGSATINFPLKFPQGPGGFTPGASINYSSNSVDELLHGIDTKKLPFFTRQSGSLGLGWSLSTGDGSIVLDNHGYDDPCRYTYKLTFPGGSAEFFKINTTTGKKAACGTEWTNSTTWRTDPEMFLKIEQGKASQIFPGDPDFTFHGELIFDRYNNKEEPVYHQNPDKERLDIWKITTSDGTEYVFGSGKQPLYAQRSNAPAYSSYTFLNKDCYYIEQVFSEVKSWKLYRVKNLFGQKIKYGYNQVWQAAILDVNTSPRQCDADVLVSKIARIEYPPNTVVFNYINTRKDTSLVKEDSGNFWAQIPEEHTYVDKDALSSIDVYANNQLTRKYNLFYDGTTWTPATSPTETAVSCRALGDSTPVTYQVKGYYQIGALQSYHLLLSGIEECIPDASGTCNATNTLPKQTFTYQRIPYDINSFSNAGTDYCRQIRTTTITDNRNSIYLASASNGFGGKTEYTFESKRISDRIYLPSGASFIDNNYDGFNCLNYCWGQQSQLPACGPASECTDDWRRTYERPFRQRGLKRARLVKVKVYDGIGSFTPYGNYSETIYDYGANIPITVLKQVGPNMEPENAYDSEFVGYANFTAYTGKKNTDLVIATLNTWSSKSKTFYHQMLTAAACAKKDPRAGSGYLSQNFDDQGIISESLQYLRFKNVADINDPWPKPNGEYCTDVPERPLVLSYGSKQITVSEGKSGSLPTPPPPQIAINSATDKSCTDFCKDIKTNCTGAGLDPSASNWRAHNFVPPKQGENEYCEIITMASCADILNNRGGVCENKAAKWTQCKCVPETTVPAGFNTLLASCAVSSNVPSYCNITSEKKEYVWDMALVDK